MAKQKETPLASAVAGAITAGLGRPDAWDAVQAAGVDCTVSEFRSVFRRAQATANKLPLPALSAVKKKK